MTKLFEHAALVAYTPDGAHINKHYAWARNDANGVFTAHDDTCSDGRWMKPREAYGEYDDFGKRRLDHSHFPDVFSYAMVFPCLEEQDDRWEDDLLDIRYELRRYLLTQPNAALIFGTPDVTRFQTTGDRRLLARPSEYCPPKKRFFAEHHSLSPGPRNNKVIVDHPRSIFTVDLDGLPVAGDVVTGDHALIGLIRDAFEDADLDWLIADCVLHLSSSHGLQETDSVRAHIEWELETPLTIKQQADVAARINMAFEAAGYGNPLDDIYQPSRLFYTTPPALFRRQVVNGEVVSVPMSQPADLQRVRIHRVKRPRLRIPDEFLEPIKRKRATRAPTQRPDSFTFDPAFRDGNTHNARLLYIYNAVMTTPYDRLAERVEPLKIELEHQIRGMEASPEKTQERIEVMFAEFDEMWNSAIEKRYGEVLPQKADKQAPASYPLESARRALPGMIRSAINEAVEYVSDRTYSTSFLPPAPTLTLIKAPPGVGKTNAFIQAVDGGVLLSNKINMYAERVELSAQTHAGMLAKFAGNEYAQQAITHLKGRKQHCHEDMDPICDMYDAQGVSPRTTVCPNCAHASTCAWPEEKPTSAPGVAFFQHAHIPTTMALIAMEDSELTPDVNIIDESPTKAFLNSDALGLSFKQIKEATKKSVVRYHKKKGAKNIPKVDHETTADLLQWRDTVMRVVRKTDGHKLRTEDVRQCSPWLDKAIMTEEKLVRQCWAHIADVAATGNHDAAEIAHWGKIKTCAELFLSLYKAIAASLMVREREHVFGVKITANNHLVAHLRQTLPVALQCRNLIMLDATANELILKATWGKEMNMQSVELNVSAQNYTLTQYLDAPYATEKFLERNGTLKRNNGRHLAQLIKRKCYRHKKVLVVAPKKIIAAIQSKFTFPQHCHFVNFGNTRGMNAFEDCDAIIILGRAMPPNYVLEEKAEAVFYDDMGVCSFAPSREGGLPRRSEWRKLRGNKERVRVRHSYHPDPYVNAIAEELVWSECIQALGRCRVVQRTEDNPVDITVLGTWDTGLEIDRVADWRDEQNYDHKKVLNEVGIVASAESAITRRIMHGYFEHIGTRRLENIVSVQGSIACDPNWDKWLWQPNPNPAPKERSITVFVHKKHNSYTEDAIRALVERETGIKMLGTLKKPRS